MTLPPLKLRGVRTHNLRNIDLDLPRNALVVISGPSGSGKSSLAIDTIFAEGQRRFVESQSVAARHYLDKVAPVPCDRIEGLTPSIALRARRVSGFPKTTVGTLSEIYDSMRLLYARCGRAQDEEKGPTTMSIEELTTRVESFEAGCKYAIVAPIYSESNELAERLAGIVSQGFSRIMLDDELLDPEALDASAEIRGRVEVYVDRLISKSTLARARIRDSLELAAKLGQGQLRIKIVGGEDLDLLCGEGGEKAEISRSPALFSFNTPLGACSHCEGRGVEHEGGALCGACQGGRLGPAACAVKVGGEDLGRVGQLSLSRLVTFLQGLHFSDATRRALAETIVPPALERISFLLDLGLGYLSLHRGADTLSGGELQRLRLARQIGSQLVGVTYVLDEPTIGLHPQDRAALIAKLRALRDCGNSVIVVEHDAAVLRAADFIVDLGPGAGRFGGQIVAQGSASEIQAHPTAPSAALLRGELRIPRRREALAKGGGAILLKGARGNNLKAVDLEIPLGRWTCVCGVSGSGKSSLIGKTLLVAAKREKTGAKGEPLPFDSMQGLDKIERVVFVGDSPVKAGPRSTPATYTGIFSEIRKLFAALPQSQLRGFGPSRFSFNAKGGRCEACQGEGKKRISMHWMADVHISCEQCNGSRYSLDTLEVQYRGYSIADILKVQVNLACEIFVRHKKVMSHLEVLRDVGLGYLELGQDLSTLSRGELARLKLAKELGRRGEGHTLYLLDEPATGLHERDVSMLIKVLRRLVQAGHTVVVVEHHLSMIAAADWAVDMGPAGGAQGGRIVAQGTPPQLAEQHESPTGRCLARYWEDPQNSEA